MIEAARVEAARRKSANSGGREHIKAEGLQMEIGNSLAHAPEELVARIRLCGPVTRDKFQKERSLLHAAIFAVAEQIGDCIFCGQVTDQGYVSLHLAIRERVFRAITHVLDADSDAVQAYAVACHPRFGHEPIDCAITIDQKVGRDVELPFALKLRTSPFDAGVAKIGPGCVKGGRYRVMQNDGLRRDGDIFGIRSVVLVDVFESEPDAFLVKGDGLVNDVESLGTPGGAGHHQRHGDDCDPEFERK